MDMFDNRKTKSNNHSFLKKYNKNGPLTHQTPNQDFSWISDFLYDLFDKCFHKVCAGPQAQTSGIRSHAAS